MEVPDLQIYLVYVRAISQLQTINCMNSPDYMDSYKKIKRICLCRLRTNTEAI